MPQLEFFLFGDQFLLIFVLYLVLYFSLLKTDFFLSKKLFYFNIFYDNLSKEEILVTSL